MEIAQPNEEIRMTRRNPALVSLALLLGRARPDRIGTGRPRG